MGSPKRSKEFTRVMYIRCGMQRLREAWRNHGPMAPINLSSALNPEEGDPLSLAEFAFSITCPRNTGK